MNKNHTVRTQSCFEMHMTAEPLYHPVHDVNYRHVESVLLESVIIKYSDFKLVRQCTFHVFMIPVLCQPKAN